MRYSDNDGNDRKDKVIGLAIGVATNVVPFSTGLRDQYSPTDPSDYNEALKAVLLPSPGQILLPLELKRQLLAPC